MLDIHFEDGLWLKFPPMPWAVNFVTRNVLWWFVLGTTRFGPCDRHGRMRPLRYAAPY